MRVKVVKMRYRDLQAPWIGYDSDYLDEQEEMEYDEDFEYESRRDMELEDEIEAKQGL
jgi:hypothetical protein